MPFVFHRKAYWILTLAVFLVLLVVRDGEVYPPKGASAPIHESLSGSSTAQSTESDAAYYRVTKVIDGDTLTIDMAGKSETLRLIGINTPETVDPRRPVECFGREASEKAKTILLGQRVRVASDDSQDMRDKYGRLLAYIFLEDGTNFNKLMIADGYAYEYTYRIPYEYQSEFKEAEHVARVEERGLWADGACGEKNVVTPQIAPTVPVVANTSTQYVCDKNTYNCSSFTTQSEAQGVFDACGGGANDIHKLDSDKDGVVCEGLP